MQDLNHNDLVNITDLTTLEASSNVRSEFEVDVDESDDYSTFMKNLTPCSSMITLDNPVEYNPVEFINLLEHRNNLYKLGTLTDDVAVVKLEGISRSNTNKSTSSKEIKIEEVEMKVLSTIDNDVMNIKFTDLLNFLNKYEVVKSEDVNVIHFLIYLSYKLKKPIMSLKVCHLGKCYIVANKLDLTKKGCELSKLKIEKFPTFHLSITDTFDDSFRMAVGTLIAKTLEQEYYPVTYMDVLTHSISNSKIKRRLKSRLKRLVKAV